MKLSRSLVTVAAILLATPVQAEGAKHLFGAKFLGQSEIFNNDFLGDGHDRWRTGSAASSFSFGIDPRETKTVDLFETMEYRLRFEMITPHNLQAGLANQERPYVGAIALGAFSHLKRDRFDAVVGGELVFIGPSTGVSAFQTFAHDGFGIPGVGTQLESTQLSNRVLPSVYASFSRTRNANGSPSILRPFLEAQAGAETYLRVGVDAVWPPSGDDVMYVRDLVTGQLIPHLHGASFTGTTFIVGADVAHVARSEYLPRDRGVTLSKQRTRVRAGVHHQWQKFGLFYGMTLLGKEFEGQSEAQRVGSLELSFNF